MTEQQNWKQFQGTELGGLMARLYGNENKPNINYPKPKQRKAAPPPVFIPGGAKHNAVDPRKSTRREVNIEVPVPTGGRRAQKFHQVDFIAHRKSADVMKNEIAEIKMRQTHYRPANSQAYSSDAEKDKFAQICQYKGGKALPEELTQQSGLAPFEVINKQKMEQERLKRITLRQQKNGTYKPPKPIPSEISPTEMLMEQITQEIKERTEYIDDLKANGENQNKEIIKTVTGEISERMAKLRSLEKEL